MQESQQFIEWLPVQQAAGESGELGLFDLAEVLWQEHHCIILHRNLRALRSHQSQHRRMFQEVKRADLSDYYWWVMIIWHNMTWFGIRVALWKRDEQPRLQLLDRSWGVHGAAKVERLILDPWAVELVVAVVVCPDMLRSNQVKSGHRFGLGYVGIVAWGHWGCLVMSVSFEGQRSFRPTLRGLLRLHPKDRKRS